MKLQFSDWNIDTEALSLHVGGVPVSVEPRVFDLLALLASHPNKIFSRDELLERVWHGRVVSDTAISSAIKSARKAIGDSGQTQRYIQTVHRRGFRFAVNADEQCDVDKPQALSPEVKTRTLAPVLLVMPFKKVTANLDEARVRKLQARIENILLRIPLLKISAEAARFEGRSVSARRIYEEVGASYLLEALIEESAGKIYLDVSLIDTIAGFRLWSEQFERHISDTAFDELVVDVVRKCEPQLYKAIYSSAVNMEGELGAHALYLKAGSLLAIQGWHADSFNESIQILRRCVTLKADFSQASAYLSLLLALGHRVGILKREQSVVDEAVECAERALQLSNQDSSVLGLVGCALCDIGLLHRGEPLLRKAISINPSNGQAWAALGAAQLVRQPPSIDKAVEYLQQGVDISPLDNSLAVWRALLAISQMMNGDLVAALEQARLACQDDDKTYMPHVVLAAIQLKQKHADSARESIREAVRLWPGLGQKQISLLVGEKASHALCSLL